jgi:hypothetical protein
MADKLPISSRFQLWLARYFPAEICIKLLLALAAVSTAASAALCAMYVGWPRDAVPLASGAMLTTMSLISLISGVISLVICWERKRSHLATTPKGPHDVNCDAHARRFLRFQTGVGYALLVASIFSSVLAAGVGHRLLSPESVQNTKLQSELCGPRLLLAIVMAVVGSLFYTANSLRKKRTCKEAFDSDYFWGGLWYRMGEAVLFTLVIFLFVRMPYVKQVAATAGATAQPAQAVETYDLMIPILGLLMGMFIRTGERLVFGLAERVFAAASVLLPEVKPRKSELKGTTNQTNTTENPTAGPTHLNIDQPAASTATATTSPAPSSTSTPAPSQPQPA